MTGTLDALQIRRRLDRKAWGPPEPFGPDGWRYIASTGDASVIVTASDFDGDEWIHASIARQHTPSYDDLVALHAAVWPTGYAYQVFAAPEHHVNIHDHALHLWGRADGSMVLPHFGALGSI